MQFLTEDGIPGYFNCDERVRVSKAQEIADKYFLEHPEQSSYSICMVDFETRSHCILEFFCERNITITEY